MRSSSADSPCPGVLAAFGGGRYWLRQADNVVFELSVFEKRLSSVEDLIVLEGMESVTKESSLRRVVTQGMDWKRVGSLVAMVALSKFDGVRNVQKE